MKIQNKIKVSAAVAAGMLVLTGSANAALMTFGADRDNTIASNNSSSNNSSSNNFGSATNFSVGQINANSGLDQQSLVSFDVTALSGLYTSIDSITMRFTHSGADTSSNTLTNNVYGVAAANADWTESGSNYNTKDGSVNWATGTNGIGDNPLLASVVFVGGEVEPIVRPVRS